MLTELIRAELATVLGFAGAEGIRRRLHTSTPICKCSHKRPGKAERRPLALGEDAVAQVSERPLGVFARQLFLGDALDTERIDATYDNGVLILRIPIAEKAKPRKITVAGTDQPAQKVITA